MKKSLFLIPALALTIASCSNDDLVNGPESGSDVELVTNYLSVNLVQASNMSTRDDEQKQYEDGEGYENTVTKVRFYFFDTNGNAASVKRSGDNYQNFYDWVSSEASTDKDSPNVEKKLQAVLVINTESGEALPTKVVAILNPDNLSLGTGNLTLSQLQGATYERDFASYANNAASPTFVMSNSVYADGNKENAIVATDIPTAYYANSIENAKANPVQIYVERAVAKVRTSVGTISENSSTYDNGYFTLKDKEGKLIKVGEKQVYMKFDNWNLTADTDKGNLLKNITPSSWSNIFGDEPWNVTDYHRSFWATNATTAKQSWHTYTAISGGKELGTSNVIYANENAPASTYSDEYGDSFSADKFTKVILSGTLYVDGENGAKTAVELCKYAGVYYAGEENLITAILASLGTNMIYSQNGTQWSSLTADDVQLVTAKSVNMAQEGEPTKGRYYVYLQLKDNLNKNWSKDQAGDDAFENAAAVNKYLLQTIGKAQVYQEGKTYYYFPIQHLGDEGTVGEYGVVRNHIYDCKITSVIGLGTPVYIPENGDDDPDDEEEDIYPEKPEDDDTFIAAQINILSWRLVSNDVNLAW